MATNTYVAIETKTITSTVTEVTFTAIPQTYTDLVLIASPKCDTTRDLQIRVGNGTLDTDNNYSTIAGWASTTTAGSNKLQNATYMYGNYYAGATATAGQNHRTYHFNNYSNTTTFKSVLERSSTASLGSDMLVGTWRSTSAINTISIFPLSGNIVADSVFTLYGIANSDIGAPKAFGGTITQDANYTYHTFGASGTFTAQQSLTADILVVAGGGGGGTGGDGEAGGGGGAGGYRTGTSLSLTSQAYTVTVGAGGVGGTSLAAFPTNGGNSTFSTITSSGGGYAGNEGQRNANSGGSGGGGCATGTGASGNSGSFTPAEGSSGGAGQSSGTKRGGGAGGGASASGAAGSGQQGGAGGAGTAPGSSWASTTGTGVNGYYAGGGGGGSGDVAGGAGGSGGGGNGGYWGASTSNTNGVANTGGGGGGTISPAYPTIVPGKAGGSGIVIIRYAK
jgi:hypothetical protein